jgi:hypothetical protein
MDINSEEIIHNALSQQANNPSKDLEKIIIGEALKTAFNVSFDKYYPDYFQENNDRPEILSFNDDRHINGEIEIDEIDSDVILDEMDLYKSMDDAEGWVNKNINGIIAQVEKQIFDELIDQEELESVGL